MNTGLPSSPQTRPPVSCAAACPFFGVCGGCDFQDSLYTDQLTWKEQRLRELLTPLKVPAEKWLPMRHSDQEYPVYFRNKIRYGLCLDEQGNYAISRHAPENASSEVAVTTCLLQSERSVLVGSITAKLAQKYEWSLYDPKAQEGWFRHLLIREGKYTGELLVGLVTSMEGPAEEVVEWGRAIAEIEGCVGVVWVQDIEGKLEDILLSGRSYLYEQLGDLRFRISLHAFFQTNSEMAAKLYQAAADAVQGSKVVWDLYAGSATIGCAVAKNAEKVLSIESNPSALEDAEENKLLNHATNLEFRSGTVEDMLKPADLATAPDAIIVDPPRAGLTQQARTLITYARPKKLVYISCNPNTFLRDALALQLGGFKIKEIGGFDLFPHSHHQEVFSIWEPRTRA